MPTNRAGKRHIDLAIITHIDHNHIGAAQLLFSDRELNLSFGDVWFNARTHLGARGVAEGQGLGELLGDAARGLAWNRAFDGLAVVTPGKGRFQEVTLAKDLPPHHPTVAQPGSADGPRQNLGQGDVTRRWSVCGAKSGTPRPKLPYLVEWHFPRSKRW